MTGDKRPSEWLRQRALSQDRGSLLARVAYLALFGATGINAGRRAADGEGTPKRRTS